MIKITPQEVEAIHSGNRVELFKAVLVDKNGIEKCDLKVTNGEISYSDDRDIQKVGSISYRIPDISKRIEDDTSFRGVVIIGDDGKSYLMSVEVTGLISIQLTDEGKPLPNPQIKIGDDGFLYSENVMEPFETYLVIDETGWEWEIGCETDGIIYSMKTSTGHKVFYHDERIEVDFLNDRINVKYGIVIGNQIRWWDKGLYVQVKPRELNGVVSTNLYDENLILKRTRILDDKVFPAGTNYIDVLQYFIIYCGVIKIRIEPTDLVLRTDVVVDSKKSCLEWFNYFAAQINYTNLYVDGSGWFVSDKYKEPTPSMVGYVYESDELSVICGDLNRIIDNTNVPNVFRRTVSHPILGELTSTYVNDDPTDKYSTVNTSMNYSEETIDNIASQEELDNYTRKEAWRVKQVTEEISFSTLNMPHHEGSEILELRHPEASGIVVEFGWSMNLKSGARMKHKAKRLVSLNDD